jgi:hypothetical protein
LVGLAGGVEYFEVVGSLSFRLSAVCLDEVDEDEDEPTDSLNESVND